MDMIGLVITICTILIIIAIFVAGYVIECHIKDLKNGITRKEIVDYINTTDEKAYIIGEVVDTHEEVELC